MAANFIVIEGGDCSGKSTFVRFLRDTYGQNGQKFVFTHEPGGNSYGTKIRRLILNDEEGEGSDNLTKFHLYWASKAENFGKVVLPSVVAGKIVVSDRFEGSTYAYQVSEDPRLDELFWLTRETCLQGIEPVYIHFDVDIVTQIDRAMGRMDEQNYFDIRGMEYRQKIRDAYLRFFDNPRIKSHRVDAGLPKDEMLESAHLVFKKIVET
jgi:dTMP kinase